MDNEEDIINNFFDSQVVSCNGTDTLLKVGKILYVNNKTHAIVKNDFGQIIGEISAEDISIPKLLQTRNFTNIKDMQAKSITKDLWCVTKDCPTYYVVDLFVYKNAKYVCVVNNQKEKRVVGEYEIDSILKYLWEWINEKIYKQQKGDEINEIIELLNERLKDIDANYISATERILKRIKVCKGDTPIMKIGMLMNFDEDGYVGVNENNKLSGFVNFERMNIYSILFEAKKRNILMHHLKAKDIASNKIFVGDENLTIRKGVEVFLKNKDGLYERLCKEGVVKFLGKIYLYFVTEPSGYLKYKNIFKISSNINAPTKAKPQAIKGKREVKSKKSKKTIPKFARDIMSENPVTCTPTETLLNIGDIMGENGFNHIIITNEKNVPISVVSAEDITVYKMIMGEGLEGIENTRIWEIMNTEIWCANTQAPFINLVHKMATDRIGSLPVINNHGILAGIITKTDIFEGVKQLIENSKEIREKIYSIKVREIMNKDVSLCFEDDNVLKKDKEMAKYRIKYQIVVEKNTKKIVGITSLNDFVLSRMRKKSKLASASSVKVGDVMNRDITAVTEDNSLMDVINIMMERHLSVVPVLEKDVVKGQVEWWKVFEKLFQILLPYYTKM